MVTVKRDLFVCFSMQVQIFYLLLSCLQSKSVSMGLNQQLRLFVLLSYVANLDKLHLQIYKEVCSKSVVCEINVETVTRQVFRPQVT
jgi:hypothetical protein